jgi:hypothetical protein
MGTEIIKHNTFFYCTFFPHSGQNFVPGDSFFPHSQITSLLLNPQCGQNLEVTGIFS